MQLAKYVNRTGAWPGAAQSTATVHFEPVAAGDVVLNSTSSYLNELLSTHYNDVVAIEMESVGVALAGHLHESTPTIAIRGISDRADGAKQDADNDGWKPVAGPQRRCLRSRSRRLDRREQHKRPRGKPGTRPVR